MLYVKIIISDLGGHKVYINKKQTQMIFLIRDINQLRQDGDPSYC